MRLRILSIIIVLTIILSGLGVVVSNSTSEITNDCGCKIFYLSEINYDSYGLSNEDIVALQKLCETEGWTFEVGENSATQYSLDDICGLRIPEGWENRAHFDYNNVGILSELPDFYDWRRENPENKNSDFIGGFPIVKDQGNCGSCWAFATVGVLECNIKIKDDETVDLSEQYLISCNTNGWDCSGGWWAHDYHQWKEGSLKDGVGAVMEKDFPYVSGTVGYIPTCESNEHVYLIKDWGFVSSQYANPSVNDIKQAIIDYGPVSVAVYADTSMQAYTGGIFNSCSSGKVNHGVVIVGWDDNQGDEGIWFMRNSWGTGWGEDGGYMRIPYGCSNIGYSACYIVYDSQQNIGKHHLDVKIHKISNHPDDGNFEPIEPPFSQPEWYYRLGINADSDTIYQYNYNRDPDGWWIFAWNSNHRWNPSENHHFYINDLSAEINIKLMDEDLWPNPDDLADVSSYTGGGQKDGANNENRGAIYHGRYNLITNVLSGDDIEGPEANGYYTTTGDGDENAKVWFKIYDPVVSNPGGPYYGVENVGISFEGAAVEYSGTPPYYYHWDFGDGTTSNKQNPEHTYPKGVYNVSLTITDSKGDSDKENVEVTVYKNTVPRNPSVDGPYDGKNIVEYSYTFSATDPEGFYGDKVSLCIDWGDNSEIEWTEYVSSGEDIISKHMWNRKGSYTIKVKAKDLNGLESRWTTKQVTIKRNSFVLFKLIILILERFLNLV